MPQDSGLQSLFSSIHGPPSQGGVSGVDAGIADLFSSVMSDAGSAPSFSPTNAALIGAQSVSPPWLSSLIGAGANLLDSYAQWRVSDLEEAANPEMGGGILETVVDTVALPVRGLTEIPIQALGLAESVARHNPLNPATWVAEPEPLLAKFAEASDEEMKSRMKGFMAEHPGPLAEAYAATSYLAPEAIAALAGGGVIAAAKIPKAAKMLSSVSLGKPGLSPRKLTSLGGATKEARDLGELGAQLSRASEAETRQYVEALSKLMDDFADSHGYEPSMVRSRVVDELSGGVVEVGDEALGELTPEIQFLVRGLRERLDEGGRALAAQKRAVGEEGLAETIEEGLGEYLHRQFLAFDDPDRNWRRIRKDPELLDELVGEMRGLERYADWSDEALTNEIRLISQGSVDEGAFFTRVDGPGGERRSIYIPRKDVPPVIDKVLGLYDDPARAAYHSIVNVEHNIVMNKMWEDMASLGVKQGWLGDTPTGGLVERAGDELLEGARAVGLDADGGLYVTKPMADWIGRQVKVERTSMLPRLTGLAKWAKTAGNFPAGHLRNTEANLLVKMATGNMLPGVMPWRKTRNRSRMAFKYGGREGDSSFVLDNLADINPDELSGLRLSDVSDSTLSDLTRRGVTSPSSDVEQINRMAHPILRENKALQHGQSPLKRHTGELTRMYRAEDEWFKIDAYRNELAKIQWHSPDMPLEQQKDIAASIVKDTWFNYSRISPAVKWVRDSPFIGNFVSFEMEVPRIIKNNVKRGLTELRDGLSSKNMNLAFAGLHRMASQTAAVMAPAATKTLIREGRKAFSEDDEAVLSADQEKAAMALLPEWARGNQFIITGGDRDRINYIDVSYVDYAAIVKDSVMEIVSAAMSEEKGMAEGLSRAVDRLSEPLVDQGIVLGPVMNAIQGMDSRGRRPHGYYPSLAQRIGLLTKGVGESVMPLGVQNQVRIATALERGRSRSGLTAGQETFRLLGPRPGTFDVAESLKHRALDLARKRTLLFGNARRAGRGELLDTGEGLTPADREALRRSMRDTRMAIEGARALGWSDEEIYESMRGAGVPKDVLIGLVWAAGDEDAAEQTNQLVGMAATRLGSR